MKEFIEKLIGRLKECEKEYTSKYGMIDIQIREVFVKIRKIVNQLAEEHNNDFCKWYSDYKLISDKYKRETGCGYKFYDLHHAEPFKFCPYCGKKIKVVD